MISNVSSILSMRSAAPVNGVPPASSMPEGASTPLDTVEFSPLGRAMAQAAAESTMRLAQLSAIRSEIQNGTYETPARIQGTVARLLESLK